MKEKYAERKAEIIIASILNLGIGRGGRNGPSR
jgi:hypothetical protein